MMAARIALGATRPASFELGRRTWSRSFGMTLLVALCVALLASAPSIAEEGEAVVEERNEEAGWSPAGSFGFGVYTQSISGDTSSDITDFPRSSGDSLISEYFQFEGKLYTPLQLDVPTKPRIFLTAGVNIPLAEELIAERIDQELISRYLPGVNQLTNPDDSAFVQQEFIENCPDTAPGSNSVTNPFNRIESCSLRIRNKVTIDAMWFVGLGVELTLPISENEFKIRPAVEYYGMAVQSVGSFDRTSAGATLDDLEEAVSGVGDPEVYHGVSPSLALSVDVYEEGPWRWSMFVQGRAIFYLNEPTIESSAALAGNNIRFLTGVDDLAFQAGGGIQVQWTGKK